MLYIEYRRSLISVIHYVHSVTEETLAVLGNKQDSYVPTTQPIVVKPSPVYLKCTTVMATRFPKC